MSNCSFEMHVDSGSPWDKSAKSHPLTSTICCSWGGGGIEREWEGGGWRERREEERERMERREEEVREWRGG